MAVWRVRACSTGLCVGAQVMITGAGVAVPVSLNAAWIAALCAPGMAALAAALCRRALNRRGAKRQPAGISRALHALAAVAFLLNAAFVCASLISLAEQSLLPQAPAVQIAGMTVLAAAVCALVGGKGVCRFAFALRYALPLGAAALCAASLPPDMTVGLFPLLGRGGAALALGCACMLGSAFPVLLLLYPLQGMEAGEQDGGAGGAPPARFFMIRIAAGAAAGAALLFVMVLGSTYQSLVSGVWGERLLISGGGRAGGGLVQTGLTILETAALLLLAAHMLLGADRALNCACPGLAGRRAGGMLCAAALSGAMLWLLHAGLDRALAIAPALLVPLLLVPLAAGKKEEQP